SSVMSLLFPRGSSWRNRAAPAKSSAGSRRKDANRDLSGWSVGSTKATPRLRRFRPLRGRHHRRRGGKENSRRCPSPETGGSAAEPRGGRPGIRNCPTTSINGFPRMKYDYYSDERSRQPVL